MKTAMRPRLAVLMGDPAGVGPEVVVKLLARPENVETADIVMLGDPRVLQAGERAAASSLGVTRIGALSADAIASGRINFVDVAPSGELPPLGQSSAEGG